MPVFCASFFAFPDFWWEDRGGTPVFCRFFVLWVVRRFPGVPYGSLNLFVTGRFVGGVGVFFAADIFFVFERIRLFAVVKW